MRTLLLTAALLVAAGCGAVSLREQVASLRREQWRDRERVAALERRLVARGERDAEPEEGLLELVEELGREVGALAEELRRRQGLEEAVEALRARTEQGVDALRRLTRQVERMKEEQWSMSRLISPVSYSFHKENKQVFSTADPFSEEGSGDLVEDSLIPVTAKELEEIHKEIPKETIKYLDVLRKQHWTDMRLLEERTNEKISNVSHQVEMVDDRLKDMQIKCAQLFTNATEDFESSMALLDNLQDDLGSLWKRVTQAEFNAAQSQAVLDVLEHDWKEDSKRIKDLQNERNVTRRDFMGQNTRLFALEALTTNLTLQRCRTDSDTTKRSLQLENVELRLAQTNQRIDEWVKRTDSGRKMDENVLRNYRDALTTIARRTENVTGEIALLQDVHTSLRLDVNKFVHQLPNDCSRQTRSGTTLIQLPRLRPFEVYCDTTTEGGPWLTIQRRLNGSVSFFRNWNEYRDGFGSPSFEFWIGNEVLHLLTLEGGKKLRIDMWDILDRYWFAEYRVFRIRDEEEQYALEIANHSGNASDAMGHHFGMGFSTHDRDNDASSANCAVHHTGGWWYQHCHRADLNGRYSLGMTWYSELTHEWLQLERVEMKIASNKLHL